MLRTLCGDLRRELPAAVDVGFVQSLPQQQTAFQFSSSLCREDVDSGTLLE